MATRKSTRKRKSSFEETAVEVNSSSSAVLDAVANKVSPKKCLMLLPKECSPENCRTVNLRCPSTGTSALYVMEREKEKIWHVVTYKANEFTTAWTSTAILPKDEPFYVFIPVHINFLLLPALLKYEESHTDLETLLSDPDFPCLKEFKPWKCLRGNLQLITNSVDDDDDNTWRCQLNRDKLSLWLIRQIERVYDHLLQTKPNEIQRALRNSATEMIREQLPIEIRTLL